MTFPDTVRADWMDEPETRAVVTALEGAGHAVRFVGGCVRDTLLGRPIGDIDMATDAVPKSVIDALQAAGIRAIPTGFDHGTITAVAGSKSFEITTLRVDVETDGRRATVQFTDDWEADAARRDLTMNAISLGPDGTIHDPFDGRSDLAAGRVRFVGDAHDRIVEDVLRLLRFFRFYAHYGTPPPDTAALEACRMLAPRLPKISGERVRAELMKLLQAPDPLPALRLMRDADIFVHFLPEAENLPQLEHLIAIESRTGTTVDPMRRLAALLASDIKSLSNVADRLRLSNAERDYLTTIAVEDVSPTLDEIARRRLIYRLGAAAFREVVLLRWAGDANDRGWEVLIALADSWTSKAFPVGGNDVLERGIARGPAVGEILQTVELWWVDGKFAADRDACLAQLDREIDKRT